MRAIGYNSQSNINLANSLTRRAVRRVLETNLLLKRVNVTLAVLCTPLTRQYDEVEEAQDLMGRTETLPSALTVSP